MNKFFLLSILVLFPFSILAASKEQSGFQFGWLAGDDKPLIRMTLPGFMKQGFECEDHKVIDRVDYCGTTDGLLLFSGQTKEGGKDLILSITGVAYGLNLLPKSKSPLSLAKRKRSEWKRNIIRDSEIKLDGHPAYRIELEMPRPHGVGGLVKNCVVVFYEYENIQGDFSIGVAEKLKSGEVVALHQNQWPKKIREYIDDTIKSVVFLKKVKE